MCRRLSKGFPWHIVKDICRSSRPAAGYRNGTSVNNVGSNGNYWSSSPNGSDNAYNLNFNGSNLNMNNNNRYNGQSVRLVALRTLPLLFHATQASTPATYLIPSCMGKRKAAKPISWLKNLSVLLYPKKKNIFA